MRWLACLGLPQIQVRPEQMNNSVTASWELDCWCVLGLSLILPASKESQAADLTGSLSNSSDNHNIFEAKPSLEVIFIPNICLWGGGLAFRGSFPIDILLCKVIR